MIAERTVLDHGYVRLLDRMGDDWTPVQAARVSTDGSLRGPDSDRKLLTFLLRSGHTSPFEMVELLWEIKLPIFVRAQWDRHRTANKNEFSGRYSNFTDPEFYVPKEFRKPHPRNPQMTVPGDFNHEALGQLMLEHCDDAAQLYQNLLGVGVGRELARLVLPQNVYTKMWWKNDMHNTLHFLNLRAAEDAQWEIQEYARAMEDIMTGELPEIMKVWRDLKGT
jgi:thymidylate synthase (FAD)